VARGFLFLAFKGRTRKLSGKGSSFEEKKVLGLIQGDTGLGPTEGV